MSQNVPSPEGTPSSIGPTANYFVDLDGIRSKPPNDKKKITNIYWDPKTKEIVIEVEN